MGTYCNTDYKTPASVGVRVDSDHSHENSVYEIQSFSQTINNICNLTPDTSIVTHMFQPQLGDCKLG
jgi:hypothetical protein